MSKRISRRMLTIFSISLLVVFVGAGLSMLAYQKLLASHIEEANRVFEDQAHTLILSFEREMNRQDVVASHFQKTITMLPAFNKAQFEILAPSLSKILPYIRQVAWIEKIAYANLNQFEARLQAEGSLGFSVHNASFLANNAQKKPVLKEAGEFYVSTYQLSRSVSELPGLYLTEAEQVENVRVMKEAIAHKKYAYTLPISIARFSRAKSMFLYIPIWQNEKESILKGVMSVTMDMDKFMVYLKEGLQLSPHFFQISSHDKEYGFIGERTADDSILMRELNVSRVYLGQNFQLVFSQSLASHSQEMYDLVINQRPFYQGVYLSIFLGFILFFSLQYSLRVVSRTEQLGEDKQRYERLFDQSPEGAALVHDATIIKSNDALNSMFQLEEGETMTGMLVGDVCAKFQPDGQSSDLKAGKVVEICIENGFAEVEWYYRRPNNTFFWAHVILTKLELKGDLHFHLAIRDVSKLKKQQENYINAIELAEKTRDSQAQFLGNISHELRTPIHGILSYAQLGESRTRHASRKTVERYFKNIHLSGERLRKLLNELLDIAKFGSGKSLLSVSKVSLYPLLESMIESQSAGVYQSKLRLHLTGFSHKTLEAEVDAGRVEQVVLNLLSNAIKFSPDGGTITIDLQSVPFEIAANSTSDAQTIQMAQITVSDEGQGVPPNELDKIFSRFEQSTKQAEGTSGTGLGLAICREVVSAHSGKIWAENNSEQGCKFSVIFPLVFREKNNRQGQKNG